MISSLSNFTAELFLRTTWHTTCRTWFVHDCALTTWVYVLEIIKKKKKKNLELRFSMRSLEIVKKKSRTALFNEIRRLLKKNLELRLSMRSLPVSLFLLVMVSVSEPDARHRPVHLPGSMSVDGLRQGNKAEINKCDLGAEIAKSVLRRFSPSI